MHSNLTAFWGSFACRQLLIWALLTVTLPWAAQAQSPPSPPSKGSGTNTVLIGVIIGVVAFIVLKSACLFYVCYWRKRKGNGRSRILNAKTQGGYATNGKASAPSDCLQEWELDTSDVQICAGADGKPWELGAGGFGKVYKGIRADVQPVAVKMVVQTDRKARENFVHEISMLKFVSRDKNIVQFYGAGLRNHQFWLVTEFMEGGDLRESLSGELPHKVTWWNGGKPIAMDVARGLAFLHANKVIHRDLKSKNILLTQDGQAKIGDVGMARIMSEGYFTHDAACGTFAWAAPELLLGDRCTEKVDVYSLGVVIWEIATGEMPIRGNIMAPDVPNQCPPEVAVIIHECMRRDPSARPTPRDVFRRLAMCPPNPCKSPILDSAEEQMGMAANLASNDKQLMDLMATLGDSGDTNNSNKSPVDSGISLGIEDTAEMNSIRAGINVDQRMRKGGSWEPKRDADTELVPRSPSNLANMPDPPPRGTADSQMSRFTVDSGSSNDSQTSSFINLQPEQVSMSPNGDVVIEIQGFPERVPIGGRTIASKKGNDTETV